MTVQADIERDRALKAAAYWREQYERAAHALQRARTGMSMTPTRRAVLAKLGDLKPGQCLSARVLSELMGWMNTGNTRQLLLALRLRWSPLGWLAFLLSNAGWLVFAWGNGHWGLFVQQCGFTLTSLMGIWRWVVQPWIESRADELIDRTIGGV